MNGTLHKINNTITLLIINPSDFDTAALASVSLALASDSPMLWNNSRLISVCVSRCFYCSETERTRM